MAFEIPCCGARRKTLPSKEDLEPLRQGERSVKPRCGDSVAGAGADQAGGKQIDEPGLPRTESVVKVCLSVGKVAIDRADRCRRTPRH